MLSSLSSIFQIILIAIGWAKDESLKSDGRNQRDLENTQKALEVSREATERNQGIISASDSDLSNRL